MSRKVRVPHPVAGGGDEGRKKKGKRRRWKMAEINICHDLAPSGSLLHPRMMMTQL